MGAFPAPPAVGECPAGRDAPGSGPGGRTCLGIRGRAALSARPFAPAPRTPSMQDLLLWRLLRQQPLPVVQVMVLLNELAHLDLRQRFPYFGYLLPLLKHDDAGLRAAAVRAL